MGIHYPNKLQLAQTPTPVHALDRFSELVGSPSRLWIKRDDLTGCATSGNKIRKLEFALAKAVEEGTDVILTCGGVQSNHARATAVLCAQLGIKVHLILRGDESELNKSGNHFLDLMVNAKISCFPSATYISEFENILDKVAMQYQQQGLRTFFIPTGASDATGVWGYVKACEEIAMQLNEKESALPDHFDHIVCATGSGGTLAGLIAGNEIYRLRSSIWGFNVCDNAAYFEKKSRQDLRDWKNMYPGKVPADMEIDLLPINVIDGYVGPGYAKAEQPVYEAIKQLAEVEGVILDPIYTGKAFYGLMQELKKGRFGSANDVLFIHTGGLFGLMADTIIKEQLA